MGQHANLVIVRGGARRLYYDHWCANRLDVELFWGPALAVEFIEQREALAEASAWHSRLALHHPTLLAFELESSLVWRGDFPTGGIHLNRNTQALHFWL